MHGLQKLGYFQSNNVHLENKEILIVYEGLFREKAKFVKWIQCGGVFVNLPLETLILPLDTHCRLMKEVHHTKTLKNYKQDGYGEILKNNKFYFKGDSKDNIYTLVAWSGTTVKCNNKEGEKVLVGSSREVQFLDSNGNETYI